MKYFFLSILILCLISCQSEKKESQYVKLTSEVTKVLDFYEAEYVQLISYGYDESASDKEVEIQKHLNKLRKMLIDFESKKFLLIQGFVKPENNLSIKELTDLLNILKSRSLSMNNNLIDQTNLAMDDLLATTVK
jgi:hypothetical protein